MANSCPNMSSPQALSIINTLGSEDYVYDIFVSNNETLPDLGIASNGKESSLYKYLQTIIPKAAKKFWFLTKTQSFKDLYGDLPKDENNEFVLTKDFIQEFVVHNELDLPLFWQPIKELGSELTTAYVKDINYRFFNIIFGESADKQMDLLNLNQDFNKIYDRLKVTYFQTNLLDKSKTYAGLVKHWNLLVANHKQYLKQFKIDTEKGVDEDDRVKDTTSYNESISTSMKDIVEDPIRMLIASLPDVTRKGLPTELSSTDIYVPNRTEFNTLNTANYNKVMTLLNNELSNSASYEDMMSKLDLLAKKYDNLGVLLRRLGIGLPIEANNEVHLMLKAMFYRSFDHNKNRPLLAIIQEGGNIIFNDMALDTVKNIIQNRWLNNAKLLAESGTGFFKINQNNKYIFDVNKILKYKEGDFEKMSALQRMEMLSKIGFIPEVNNADQLSGNHPAVINFLKWFRSNIKEGYSLNDLFNRDVFKIRGEINALLDAAATFEANDVDLMYFNQDGKLEYSVTLNSYLTQTAHRLTKYSELKKKLGIEELPEEIQHLTPFNVNLNKGNHYTVHSKALGEPMNIVLLKGLKAENKDGEEISKLTMTDYKGFTFSAILKGLIPYLRSADRKLEYALEIPIFASKLSGAETEIFISDALDYLKDELTVTFAFFKGSLGHDLKNASRHLSSLRTFDFLFEGQDLSDLLFNFYKVNKKTKLYDKDGNQILAEKFIDQYKESIEEELVQYFNKNINLNLQSLLDSGVIIDLNENEYAIKSLDKETINKLITVSTVGDENIVQKNQFRSVVQLATYNYFIGTQEQLKLILGDLANFSNPIQVHKRTNGGTSTKTSNVNSQEVLDIINNLYQFMDGTEVTKTTREIVYQDVTSENETLGNIYKEYLDINSSDGQAHSTLDEYRRLMLRNGLWGDKEKTYQYESQLLALKILNNLELQEIFPFTKEDFIKLFGKHTNNSIPKVPQYNGENETLGNIYKEYLDINSSDGQAHSTLDEYRRLMLRNGLWGDKEKTYQYESQLLALKILNNLELQEIFPFTKEDFIKLFGKHTNNSIPKVPQYNGENIDVFTLPVLTPLKPQGFGNKANYNQDGGSFTTNDFSKMSISPLFPSTLSDDKLKHYLSMMANKVGLLFFESGKKSDISINPESGKSNVFDGSLVTSDNIISELNYDNFSLQVDIHDEITGKVKMSTQRTRLEFIDLFSKGDFIGQDPNLQKLKIEFDNIIGELISRDRQHLLDELGLELNSEGHYRLLDNNVPKFKKRVLNAFLVRNMPYNVVDGLISVLKSRNKIFDVLVNKREIESVLLSLGRNDVLSRKINGLMLVQESNAYYQEDLKFYTNDNGNITSMEVMIPLPEAWHNYVKSLGGLSVFNEMLANGKLDPKIYTYPSNRIPSHGLNSLESITVKKFLPSYVGAKVVLPAEIVVKSGSDFDIDKLTTYFKHVKFKNDELQYVNFSKNLKTIYEKRYGGKLKFYASIAALDADNHEKFLQKLELLKQSKTDPKALITLVLNSDEEMSEAEEKLINSNLESYADFLRFKEEIKQIPSEAKFLEEHTTLDKQVNYIKANSKEALENRLMEISSEVTLSSERFEDLVKPTNANILKSLASEVIDHSAFKTEVDKINNGKWSNVTQLWYNLLKAESFWTAKSGLALTATHIVAHASQQHTPIRIESPVVELFFPKQNGSLTLGLLNDTKNNKISNILAEFLTAFVDAATDDFVSKINANPATITTIGFLLRAGVEQGTSPELIVKFLTQPIILDYLKQQSIQESITYQSQDGYQDKDEIVLSTLDKHGIPKERFDGMLYPLIKNYLDDPTNDTLKEYQTERNFLVSENSPLGYKILDLKTLSKKKLTDTEQVQILDNFLSYQQYGRFLTKLQQVTRPDAGLLSSRNEVRYLLDSLEKLKDSNFFNNEDLDNFINGSFLKESFNTREIILKSLEQFFLFENPRLRELYNKYFTYLDELNLPVTKLNKILTDVEDNFVTALMINGLTKNISNDKLFEYYKRLFIGTEELPSLAKRALKLKNRFPNNALLSELTPLIQEFNNSTGRELTYDNIKLYNRKFTTDERNSLTSAFEELLESKDKVVSTFAIELVNFLFMQSGLSNSPINFISIIPNKILLEKVGSVVIPEGTLVGKLFDDILRNSWGNTNIIPKMNRYAYITNTGKPKETIPVKGRRSKYPFVTKVYYTVSKEEKKKLQLEKKRVPRELILYRNTGESIENKSIFKIVGKLGDGYRLTELYLLKKQEVTPPSIINSNNLNYKFEQIVSKKPELKQTQEPNWDDVEFTKGKKQYSLGSEFSGLPEEKLTELMKNYLQAKIGRASCRETV